MPPGWCMSGWKPVGVEWKSNKSLTLINAYRIFSPFNVITFHSMVKPKSLYNIENRKKFQKPKKVQMCSEEKNQVSSSETSKPFGGTLRSLLKKSSPWNSTGENLITSSCGKIISLLWDFLNLYYLVHSQCSILFIIHCLENRAKI